MPPSCADAVAPDASPKGVSPMLGMFGIRIVRAPSAYNICAAPCRLNRALDMAATGSLPELSAENRSFGPAQSTTRLDGLRLCDEVKSATCASTPVLVPENA